jgi:chromate transporter
LYFFIQDNPKIESAFISIRASIVAIIAYAAIKIGKTAVVDKATFCILLVGIPVLFFLHPVIVIVAGAVAGIVTISIKRKLGYDVKWDRKDMRKEENDFEPFMGAGI